MSPATSCVTFEGVLQFLTPHELCRLSTACRPFYEQICATHSIWRELCVTEMWDTVLGLVDLVGECHSTWRELFLAYRGELEFKWTKFGDVEGLEKMRYDKNEYSFDRGSLWLGRGGGHYFFKVAFKDLTKLAIDNNTLVSGKWNPVKAVSLSSPSPRRHHSLTCLDMSKHEWPGTPTSLQAPSPQNRKAVVVFGGLLESYPFDALNDVHVMLLEPWSGRCPRRITGEWVRPDVVGSPPSPRYGHTAYPIPSSEFTASASSTAYNKCAGPHRAWGGGYLWAGVGMCVSPSPPMHPIVPPRPHLRLPAPPRPHRHRRGGRRRRLRLLRSHHRRRLVFPYSCLGGPSWATRLGWLTCTSSTHPTAEQEAWAAPPPIAAAAVVATAAAAALRSQASTGVRLRSRARCRRVEATVLCTMVGAYWCLGGKPSHRVNRGLLLLLLLLPP